jgi:hypothetical protein
MLPVLSSFLRSLMSTAIAAPTVADCVNVADAPSPFGGQTCASICAFDSSSGVFECDLGSCSSSSTVNEATIVHDYNVQGAHHFVGYGKCDDGVTVDDWCCVIDDDPTTTDITGVKITGSDAADDLSLHEPSTGDRVKPHRTAGLGGHVYGAAGADVILGSPYAGSGYDEGLHGEDGADTIYGQDGAEYIDGGAGNDTISGDDGNDRMHGGDGVDTLLGGQGNDAYCDTSEDSLGVCTANLFNEGAAISDDIFWLDDSGSCAVAGDLDGNSDAYLGTDRCGDSDTFTAWAGCNTPISTEPTACSL